MTDTGLGNLIFNFSKPGLGTSVIRNQTRRNHTRDLALPGLPLGAVLTALVHRSARRLRDATAQCCRLIPCIPIPPELFQVVKSDVREIIRARLCHVLIYVVFTY